MAVLTASVGPCPAYLPADFRYGTDDWQGSNALTYIVWQIAPVDAVYAADGVTMVSPAVPGEPYDLTGCAVSGTIRYRPRDVAFFITPNQPVRTLPALQGIVGSIVGDPKGGEVALSVPRSVTALVTTQSMDAWGIPGGPCLYPEQSMLIARPMVTDPTGVLVSIGDQPLFVF